MQEITRQVRELYEAFPYPSQADGTVADVHPRLMLSYLEASRAGPLEILDAGCGTGMACLGTALCNPDCQVTAVDVNRVALERVEAQARKMGLKNLRLVEADLMEPLEGSYDLIVSSGVLHHLSDPAKALTRLRDRLRPNGALRLMVYNRLGREGIYRFVRALDLLSPRDRPIEERLKRGRALMQQLLPGAANAAPWTDGAAVSDVEFVDRYLHPHDLSYNVPEWLTMAHAAGLKLLRWYEPRDWTAASVCGGDALEGLEGPNLWAVVELLGHRKQLDGVFCHPDARPRESAGAILALSPQVTWLSGRRLGGETLFTFVSSVVVREGPERLLSPDERAVLEALGGTAIECARLEERLRPLLDEGRFRAAVGALVHDEVLFSRTQ